MIRKYIRGKSDQASAVLKELIKLGAIDTIDYFGNNEDLYYWVGENNKIETCEVKSQTGKLIEECFDEIILPKERIKVIRGNKERGKEVIKLLEDMGGLNKLGFKGESSNAYYSVIDNSIVCKLCNDEFFNDLELEILELPEIKVPNHQFKPFQKVLVRDSLYKAWICNFFSHIDESKTTGGYTYACSGGNWRYCIPFEGNEHLAGTITNID